MALTRLGPIRTSRGGHEEPLPNILYVEDDDANWRVTERFLRGKYRLSRARNSDEAAALLSREKYDLILLDIELSGSRHDGIEICRLLRGRSGGPDASDPRWQAHGVPIVFVTAYAARYSKEALLEAGADDVVTKPVDYTRLLLVSSRLIVRSLKGSPGSGRPT
jgi:CheY-like chemotaxis protein